MRRSTFAGWLLLVALEAAAAEPRLSVPYEMFRLDNGLTVVVHEDHSAPIVSVNTWYRVGSARERPGRTGFAHLFEHIMFEGSAHVPEGAFDRWLEALGGDNNASTGTDRTNYWEDVPSNALETPLFLEADRMGFLLGAMSPGKVDGQRDVVKNERRETYENRPYGMAELTLVENMYPPEHPYHWPVIGSMADLSAARYEDVVDFFQRFYGPGNATLVVAGDVSTAEVRRLVEKWFSDLPPTPPRAEPLVPHPVTLEREKRLRLEDKVQLPRLYLQWPAPPRFSASEPALAVLAELLAGGKNSRLHRRLVYELEVAQDVSAALDAGALAATFNIVVTARSGHGLAEIAGLVDEELARVRRDVASEREMTRIRNRIQAGFYDRLETVGGFSGKADQMNSYLFYAHDPDYFEEDLARYLSVAPTDLRAVAQELLGPGRLALSVVPAGHAELGLEAP